MGFTLANYTSGAEVDAVVNINLNITLRILDAWGLIAWIFLLYLSKSKDTSGITAPRVSLKQVAYLSSKVPEFEWKNWNKIYLDYVIVLDRNQPFSNFREHQLLNWIIPSPFCHVLNTWKWEDDMGFGAPCKTRSSLNHCSVPSSANDCKCPNWLSPGILLEVRQGGKQISLLFRCVFRVYMCIMHSDIFPRCEIAI